VLRSGHGQAKSAPLETDGPASSAARMGAGPVLSNEVRSSRTISRTREGGSMGDKSPKSKERQKKQDTAHKNQEKAAAIAKAKASLPSSRSREASSRAGRWPTDRIRARGLDSVTPESRLVRVAELPCPLRACYAFSPQWNPHFDRPPSARKVHDRQSLRRVLFAAVFTVCRRPRRGCRRVLDAARPAGVGQHDLHLRPPSRIDWS
jgi:hypothetical protein